MSRRTLAAATAVLIFVALLFAYVLDVTGNQEGDADVVGWLIVSAVASLIAALLLMRFVPASEAEPTGDNKPARRALILGVLSLITTGQARAPQEGQGGQATAAAVLATLAIVVSIVFCITG